jgi:hypothetical protein
VKDGDAMAGCAVFVVIGLIVLMALGAQSANTDRNRGRVIAHSGDIHSQQETVIEWKDGQARAVTGECPNKLLLLVLSGATIHRLHVTPSEFNTIRDGQTVDYAINGFDVAYLQKPGATP